MNEDGARSEPIQRHSRQLHVTFCSRRVGHTTMKMIATRTVVSLATLALTLGVAAPVAA